MLNVELLRFVHLRPKARAKKGIWKGGFGTDSAGLIFELLPQRTI
jgi:hypothetical protein